MDHHPPTITCIAVGSSIGFRSVPLFADQFENGRRIAQAGAGLVVEAAEGVVGSSRRVIATEDAPHISDAIAAVIESSSFREQSRRIASDIAEAPTVDTVLGALLTRH
jgi:UDP:flavonoid glycosyltransferase YjiC (YdhE family)